MDDDKDLEEKWRNRPLSAEELAIMEVSEDRRLIRMGINPDGDPIEIMKKVQKRHRELEEAERKQRERENLPPD